MFNVQGLGTACEQRPTFFLPTLMMVTVQLDASDGSPGKKATAVGLTPVVYASTPIDGGERTVRHGFNGRDRRQQPGLDLRIRNIPTANA